MSSKESVEQEVTISPLDLHSFVVVLYRASPTCYCCTNHIAFFYCYTS